MNLGLFGLSENEAGYWSINDWILFLRRTDHPVLVNHGFPWLWQLENY